MTDLNFIYLDYQASTPIQESVIDAMLPYLKGDFANPHSSQHIAGIRSYKAIEHARVRIAKLINADPNEIIFTSGATEANNLALLGLCTKNPEKKRILISAIEHKSVLAPAEHLKSLGYKIDIIPVTKEGLIHLDQYKNLLDEDVLLVSIIAGNNEIGTIQSLKKCAEMAKSSGALFHTDAAQAPFSMELDVKKMEIDLLSLSSHKMYGPKGIGALYIESSVQNEIQPIIWGGNQQNGLRSGTLPTHLCVGFGAASEFVWLNRKAISTDIEATRNYFWEKLQEILPQVSLIGPGLDNRHVGNLNVAFPDIDADNLLGMLQTEIAASTGSACTSGTIEPSHVLSAIGLNMDMSETCIRFSFGINIPKNSIEAAVSKIGDAVRSLSN